MPAGQAASLGAVHDDAGGSLHMTYNDRLAGRKIESDYFGNVTLVSTQTQTGLGGCTQTFKNVQRNCSHGIPP